MFLVRNKVLLPLYLRLKLELQRDKVLLPLLPQLCTHHNLEPTTVPISPELSSQVRALDSLPCLGSLRTLDLKGNDLRTGLGYLSQVSKRTRTLKVLNLCENKIDVQGPVGLGEALVCCFFCFPLRQLMMTRNIIPRWKLSNY